MTKEEIVAAGFMYSNAHETYFYEEKQLKVHIKNEHEGNWDVCIWCSKPNIQFNWNARWNMNLPDHNLWEWVYCIDRLEELLLEYHLHLPIYDNPKNENIYKGHRPISDARNN